MHILVTNDDGVQAPGLLALAAALDGLAKITVMAPDRNWTASGHVKTLDRPLRVRSVTLADGRPALTTDGAPADCVALALLGVIEEPLDLIVSGINNGENIGQDLTYSGTVTAAMEAVITGLPGVAISQQRPARPDPVREENGAALDYANAAAAARQVVERVIRYGLPQGVLLNVNVPYLEDGRPRGIQITRQGLRIYRDELVKRFDPRNRPYYWIGGEAPGGVLEPGTDYGALQAGFISVSPIQLDLTAYAALSTLQTWEWE
jgi:5'-nucleotidase